MSVTADATAREYHPHYDSLTLALHWLSLLAVVSAVATGWMMEDIPKGPAKTQMVNLHASFGTLILALTSVRLLWRTAAPTVEPLKHPWWLYVAARWMQIALYTLLVAIPVSGMMILAAKGRAFDVFGLFTVPPIPALSGFSAYAVEEAHEAMVNTMITLVGLHTAAALLHRVVLKDDVMQRMLPAFLRRQ